MFTELQFPRFKGFAAFQTYYLSTNVRITPKFSSVSRRRKCVTTLRTHRTRGTLLSSCLHPNELNREDLSQKPHCDHGSDQTILTTSEFGFILTSIVTGTAGGPALTIWGLFFLILGKYTSAPTWLQAMSTCIFAGISDALRYNWTNLSFDSGYFPFVVYFFGCGATLLYELAWSSTSAEEYGRLPNSNRSLQESGEGGGASHNHDVLPNAGSRELELAKWDDAFNEAGSNTDGNAN